ncbi:MAG: ATP-binding cassette domain-containing protein [Actinomycetota bacterium]|nr:ATP-binding cassette domain-containing protein [Actinomycetota bacterium]
MNGEGRVAGSDTREALGTATVRKAARAAILAGGIGWMTALAAPGAIHRAVRYPTSVGPWIVVGLIAAGFTAALSAWWLGPDPGVVPLTGSGREIKRFPVGVGSAAAIGAGAIVVAVMHDKGVTALLVPCAPILAGWIVGTCARTAAAACVPGIRSAAAGVIIAWTLMGLAIAGHLALITRGSGVTRAGAWAASYATLAVIALVGAARSLPADRKRIAVRARVVVTDPDDAPSRAALDVDSVTVAFGANVVLHDATLRISPGELVALVGGNGAGKSTLLRAVAGLVPVQSGRITVARDDVTDLQPEERTAAGLAFVSGARPIFPDLTVMENLRVAAFRSHPTARSFSAAADSVLELVPALVPRRRSQAGVLSGGEQRLLAVAQTLFRRPAILLADELSLGLDLQARLALLDVLRLLADQGVGVVVVDHDLPSLLPRSDRAALLGRGTIELFDKPEELLTRRSDLVPATFLAGATV